MLTLTGRILLNAFVSGLTSLDSIHAFQWMIARPVFAGAISGFVMGDIPAGMLCGACIELVWLGVLPIGNYTPPDAHAAATVAATMAAIWHLTTDHLASAVMLGVLAAVPVGIVSKLLDYKIRSILAEKTEELLKGDPPYHLAGMTAVVFTTVAGKSALAVLLGAVIAIVSIPLVQELVSTPALLRGFEYSLMLMPALGMVQVSRCLGARGRERYVAAGAAVCIAGFLYLVLS